MVLVQFFPVFLSSGQSWLFCFPVNFRLLLSFQTFEVICSWILWLGETNYVTHCSKHNTAEVHCASPQASTLHRSAWECLPILADSIDIKTALLPRFLPPDCASEFVVHGECQIYVIKCSGSFLAFNLCKACTFLRVWMYCEDKITNCTQT